jgi:endonuclease G
MRLSHFFFYSLLLTCTFSSCSHDDGNDNGGNGNSGGSTVHANVNANPTTNPAYSLLEFPHVKGGNSMVIVHQAVLNSKTNLSGVNYSVEWDCNKKAQRWSCYEMYESIKASNTSRYYSDTDQYPQDQSIPSQYRFASDPFWGTGFNHGHICPSADRLGSADANYQTFFLSNMQPQWYAFNGGIWRRWKIKYDHGTNIASAIHSTYVKVVQSTTAIRLSVKPPVVSSCRNISSWQFSAKIHRATKHSPFGWNRPMPTIATTN